MIAVDTNIIVRFLVRDDEKQADAVEQIGIFLTHLDELRESRRNHPVPDIYKEYADPVPVQVTKVYAGGWGSEVPIAVPPEGRIQVIMQTVLGEERASVLKELEDWLDSVLDAIPRRSKRLSQPAP